MSLRATWFLLALVLAGCGKGMPDPAAPEATAWTANDTARNNRGVALMGYFDYPAALAVFAELAAQHPAQPDVRINLAIATLNRQEEGDETRAMALVDEVLAGHPGHLRAQYIKGLLLLNGGFPDEAQQFFKSVSESRPDDAYAAYFRGQTLSKSGQLEAAVAAYRRAIAADPYLRSAYYGAAQTLRRLKQTEAARALLDDYQRFEDNPRARLAEFKYTRMGSLAEAATIDTDTDTDPVQSPDGPVFVAAGLLVDGVGGIDPARSSLTTADIDGNGVNDLFIAGGSGNAVLYGRQDGSLVVAAGHPLAGIAEVRAALWGDIDNDGDIDVYLCRDGGNALWLQDGDGAWHDATVAAGVAGDDLSCVDGAIIDADHDGDLDLFVVNDDGPDELFSNNTDGTFRPLAQSQGLNDDVGNSRAVLTADIDRDRDTDLVVVGSDGVRIMLNDRLWSYRRAGEQFDRLRSARLVAAVAADVDADGQVEIYAVEQSGAVVRFAPDAQGNWQRHALDHQVGTADTIPALALVDFDGDGLLDLYTHDAAGISVKRVAADDKGAAMTASLLNEAGAFAAAIPVLFDAVAGPSLLALSSTPGGAVLGFSPGSGRWPFVSVALTGKEEKADSMRSNRSGIGTRLSLRSGVRWSVVSTFDNHSGAGASVSPVALGLGPAGRADYVAIDWSDGVFQTELDLAPGPLLTIAETQRQLSSCPVLFAWNGERYAFVSDILGVGGIGFFVSPGRYAEPRPWEHFLFPNGAIAPKDGFYKLKITEPMEEIAYLDSVRLHVFDLPQDWFVVPDDRMATGAPVPTGLPLFYRRERLPTRVVNDRGEDVTAHITSLDARAAPPGALDRRFIGRLAGPHVLTIEFDSPIDADTATLVADGWVEYPYSQTVFAAWQAGVTYDPPTLEARADGVWHNVYRHFGYPAGMPRRMALPLPDLPAGTTALRLSSNLEIYWDTLRVVYTEQPPEHAYHVLTPVAAVQTQPGFALRQDGPQRRPGYDYARQAPVWDTRHLAGWYSGPGDVLPLLTMTDDAVAVVGPGEEVQLSFEALPAAPALLQRMFVLEVRGWAKDMDLYTRDGGTVEPMPSRNDRVSAHRDRLHESYLQRYQAGH